MYDYNDLFVMSNLPGPLTLDELKILIKQTREGDTRAREKIALHNIKLVINIVLSRFCRTEYDIKELISVGLIGLVNAINTFDEERNKAFSSYAGKCIENEIFMFMKKNRGKEESLDEVVFSQKGNNTLRKSDIVVSPYYDVVSDYERNEIISIVKNEVEQLNGRDREIIKLYFGFYNDRQYSQNEIAIMMGMTRSNVSRIIKYSLQILCEKFKQNDILFGDFNIRSWVYNSKNKNSDKIEDISLLKTIYGYFYNYSFHQVDSAISMLDEEERSLLILRYGIHYDDLSCGNKMSMIDLDRLYGIVIPKIRRLLDGNDVISKKRNLIIS